MKTTQNPFCYQRKSFLRFYLTVNVVASLNLCLKINTSLPSHSMTPAQSAAKASTALTTASRPHQNPQKPAPSGQSNKRGRRSEKRGKQLYLLYCFQETCFSPQTFPYTWTAFKKTRITCITVITCRLNSHDIRISAKDLYVSIFTVFKIHYTQKDVAVCRQDVEVMCPSRYAALLGGFLND